jgi:hypothetical protein
MPHELFASLLRGLGQRAPKDEPAIHLQGGHVEPLIAKVTGSVGEKYRTTTAYTSTAQVVAVGELSRVTPAAIDAGYSAGSA